MVFMWLMAVVHAWWPAEQESHSQLQPSANLAAAMFSMQPAHDSSSWHARELQHPGVAERIAVCACRLPLLTQNNSLLLSLALQTCLLPGQQ